MASNQNDHGLATIHNGVVTLAILEGFRGTIGAWQVFDALAPTEAGAACGLERMRKGDEVVSTDPVRSVGGLQGAALLCLIAARENSDEKKLHRLAVLTHRGVLYIAGLMGRGNLCYLHPTGKASREKVSFAILRKKLTDLSVSGSRHSGQGEEAIEARKKRDRERVAERRAAEKQGHTPDKKGRERNRPLQPPLPPPPPLVTQPTSMWWGTPAARNNSGGSG